MLFFSPKTFTLLAATGLGLHAPGVLSTIVITDIEGVDSNPPSLLEAGRNITITWTSAAGDPPSIAIRLYQSTEPVSPDLADDVVTTDDNATVQLGANLLAGQYTVQFEFFRSSVADAVIDIATPTTPSGTGVSSQPTSPTAVSSGTSSVSTIQTTASIPASTFKSSILSSGSGTPTFSSPSGSGPVQSHMSSTIASISLTSTPLGVSPTQSAAVVTQTALTARSHAGAIAGGVVGGLFVMLLTIFGAWCYVVRRKRRAIASSEGNGIASGESPPHHHFDMLEVEPFVAVSTTSAAAPLSAGYPSAPASTISSSHSSKQQDTNILAATESQPYQPEPSREELEEEVRRLRQQLLPPSYDEHDVERG